MSVFVTDFLEIFIRIGGVFSSWEDLRSPRVVSIDSVITILLIPLVAGALHTLQDKSIAKIDDDDKGEICLVFGKAKRVASCHFDHPCDLLLKLACRKLPTRVHSVDLQASFEHFVAEICIVPRFIKKVLMSNHKTNGLHDYLVFVVKLDGLDLSGRDNLEVDIVATHVGKCVW